MRRVKKRVCLHHSRVLLFTLSSMVTFPSFDDKFLDLNYSYGGTLMIRALIYRNEISPPRTEAEGQCEGRRHGLPLNRATTDYTLSFFLPASSGN